MNPLTWPHWLRLQIVAVAWAVVWYPRIVDGPPSIVSTLAALVVALPVIGWYAIHIELRQRDAANRYLRAVTAP
ncbi:hypothetical protein J2S43_001978 [Catenuloplanes nepalensis]|uniref:Uncharacterized protein n=1 Tax=Catenuloplanes nepalensis TaxID=587533 RepID=A0ABT9MPW8_9ACTN|nr:hypothetical protein [Catenuloplanes nepalensis]MDP9793466.1 hypothetical protein [Catenuloplanes nepalensis]